MNWRRTAIPATAVLAAALLGACEPDSRCTGTPAPAIVRLPPAVGEFMPARGGSGRSGGSRSRNNRRHGADVDVDIGGDGQGGCERKEAPR